MNSLKRMLPTVSVVLPTFNRGYVLPKAIESVLNQTFANFELIISDDGSTDDTQKIAEKYVKSDSRVFYDKFPNMGVAFAKNRGVFLSEGTFVTFLDSDDEYLSDHLALRVAETEKDPDAEAFYGSMKINGDEYVPDMTDSNKKIHVNETSMGSTLFVRKSVFEIVGGYRNMFGEDGELLGRIQAFGSKVIKLPYQTYVYNRGLPDSLTSIEAERRNK